MRFTYESYIAMVSLLKTKGYVIADYHNWIENEKCVILRHDIDYDLQKAVEMAQIERSIGVKSTYFVLLTSDFYNVFSKKSNDLLKEIINNGHELGLHFDEVNYPEIEGNAEKIKEKILEECEVLSRTCKVPITTVSMHRPSKMILESDLKIPSVINSYGNEFFKGFKYLSDSRRRWREPVDEVIAAGTYQRLHILTHAFWYNDTENSIQESLLSFINSGNEFRYSIMNDNFTHLDEEIRRDQIIGMD